MRLSGVMWCGCGSGCRRSGVRRRAGSESSSGARRSLSVTTRAPAASSGRRAVGELPPEPRGAAGTEGRGRPDRMRRRGRVRRAARDVPGIRSTTPSGGATPSASRLARATAAARASRSTRTARAAPRDSASMPSAPEPAKRSSTTAPSSGPSDREQRLADAVGRRARRPARRGLQPAPAEAAGDHAHGALTPGWPAVRRRRGRRAARRPAARARARRARGRSPAGRARRVRARSSSVAVLGQAGEAEARPGPTGACR